ncbi:Clan CA, family C19, ubiquitin hydrolase-like cysteine peptidase [Histomonas meleagridis]|uniref:Clan CA, family C19, ubiquitin hydrolase-like cysteine peptidase n=1 Tax=Histomonas meleagridis TaxID=135588 RepID=UPI00355AB20C|nr:Clan CA, family C19, ubiquitin hydrolase-like cysteine peptidase [Histomonas meleagridis]KAH0802578.1 Clan CA, family C19, ubiquitin hydrolase-like cysteine peptidase [Histomonas meleagridis]
MLSDNIETIERSPRLLFVHIQRIEFNKETNETTKDSSPMIISDSLRINDETYSIYSIVQHIGRSNSGHYISFIHDSDGWLKCNDSRVTSISASDVFTSSFDERSPAYLVAYVHSFTDVLSIRNRIEAASHSLKLVFFDAKKMKKEAEFESSTNSVTDAISLVKEVKSQWESRFKCTLSTRYQLGNQRMTRDFPHDPGEVLVWFERLSMRNFNPTNVKIEPIRVTFGICDTSLHFNVFFHPEQTTKSVYSFGKRFMTDFLHSRECNLRLYIEIYEQLVIINSDYDKTLFELQCYYEDLRFFISINNPTPRNLMYAKVNLFQTDNKLDQLDPIKYPVHLDETIDCLLDYAKEQLHVGSCVLYSMKYDNEIPTMHEICGNPNLIDVVANEKELRAERSPEVNSNNCYIEGIGICFKFAIESEENIDEIEERIGKYLANYVGSQRVRVAFRVGDMLTRPYVPGEEMDLHADNVTAVVSVV